MFRKTSSYLRKLTGLITHPVLWKELRASLRSNVYRNFLLGVSALAFLVSSVMVFLPEPAMEAFVFIDGMLGLLQGYWDILGSGTVLFLLLYGLLTVIGTGLIPLHVYTSFLQEKENRSLELLALTSQTAGDIITGKLYGGMVKLLLLMLAVCPFLLVAYTIGTVSSVSIFMGLIVLLGAGLILTTLALLLATLTHSRISMYAALSILLGIAVFAITAVPHAGAGLVLEKENVQWFLSKWHFVLPVFLVGPLLVSGLCYGLHRLISRELSAQFSRSGMMESA